MPRIALAVLSALLLAAGLLTIDQASADDTQEGPKVFEAQRCASCHSIESLDIGLRDGATRNDLSEVGKTRDVDWLKGFLQREIEVDGQPHRGRFRGSDEELQTLTAWLATLGK